MSKKETVRKYFSLAVEFVEERELMKNCFSYTKEFNDFNVAVTPCGSYLMVCIL